MSLPHKGVANLNSFACGKWYNMKETQYKLLHIFCYPQWKAFVPEIAAIQVALDKLQWGKKKKTQKKVKTKSFSPGK